MSLRKLLSLGLALLLLLGCVPLAAAAEDDALPFRDVAPGAWYAAAVRYCYYNGIMAGTSQDTFEPNGTVTREMVAQIIYRLAGGIPVAYEATFKDVPEGKWYTNPILWDVAQGLAYGISVAVDAPPEIFGVGQATTREQVVTFLYRYDGAPEPEDADTSSYADFTTVGGWAQDAMLWAVNQGILVGTKYGDAVKLNPKSNCTRAELAQIVRRYLDASSRTSELLPETDSSPALSEAVVTIDGVRLPRSYGSSVATEALIRLSDLSLVWPCSAVETGLTEDGSGYHCTLTVNGTPWEFTMGTDGVLYDGISWYLPAKTVPLAYGLTQYYDPAIEHIYFTRLPDVNKIPSGVKVPVLMYHAVSDNCWGIKELFVSPGNMEAQLKYMVNHNYHGIWFEDLDRVGQISKPVILTFDDGYRDNYTELFPLLKKYNVKATIFIFPQNIGKEKYLTWDMVREMVSSGLVSFQSHTMTHPDLDTLSAEKQRWELSESQRIITSWTGKQCFVLCYPSGKYNNTTLSLAKEYYLFGIKMNGNLYTTGTNRYLIPRYYVSRSTTLSSFAAMLN